MPSPWPRFPRWADWLLPLLVGCFCLQQAVWAACSSLADIIDRGSVLLADGQGREVVSCHPDQSLIPASLIKIATVLAALRILGPDYHFTTEFFVDQGDNLYIRGSGDPLLISEEVTRALEQLRQQGVATINNIRIDDSRFALRHQPPGLGRSANPYDAPIGPVAVNFNSVGIVVDDRGGVHSLEPQTPDLEFMKILGRGLRPGRHRVHVCWRGGRPAQQSARLTGELFRALQRRAGIPGKGTIGRGMVPARSRLVLTYSNSHSLVEVCRSLLQYSNNFMANLLYLACGAARFGYPATWDKARQAVSAELAAVLGPDMKASILQEDGAGLSRQNRITARAMHRLLVAFQPWAGLLPGKQGGRIKTGTLRNVFNVAGYLRDNMPVVILLNQKRNTRDTVLARLRKLAGRSNGDR